MREMETRNICRILGLDIAKKTFKCCALTKEKNFQDRRITSGEMTAEGRAMFIGSLRRGDLVAMEGGTSSFNFAREIIDDGNAEVIVLNPAKLHIIFKSQCKTDKQDAAKIAMYVRDTNRENWVTIDIPSRHESELRSIINAYNAAKKERVRGINRLHAIFNQAGHPKLKASDLATNTARMDSITRLLNGVPLELSLIEENNITSLESNIERYEELMRSALMHHARETLIWMSIPGINFKTASALIAYCGDGRRFYNPSQIRNYIGLVPRIDQSGERCIVGSITLGGCKPIRKNIIQGAWSIRNLSYDCPLKDHLTRLVSKGKKLQKVQVAVANKMISIGWTLLKNGQLYSPTPKEVLKRKLREAGLQAIDTSFFPELN